jgi:hypothetical protein
MTTDDYIVVGVFSNDTADDMTLCLEMLGEEVVLSPGHQVELLAAPDPDLLPITVSLITRGLQIHPHRVGDPDWHVRFNGQLIRAGHPTRLKDFRWP